jgi:hypothetical protein
MIGLISTTLVMSVYVFVAALVLYVWAYKKGIELPKSDNDDWDDDGWDDDLEIEEDASSQTGNPLLKHWLDFGAGYYGTIAFVELMKIELKQAAEFISQWQGLDSVISEFSINAIVNLFVNIMIEQYQNFVAAIIWPSTYLQKFTVFECGAFVLVTYGAYWAAKQIAGRRAMSLKQR